MYCALVFLIFLCLPRILHSFVFASSHFLKITGHCTNVPFFRKIFSMRCIRESLTIERKIKPSEKTYFTVHLEFFLSEPKKFEWHLLVEVFLSEIAKFEQKTKAKFVLQFWFLQLQLHKRNAFSWSHSVQTTLSKDLGASRAVAQASSLFGRLSWGRIEDILLFGRYRANFAETI